MTQKILINTLHLDIVRNLPLFSGLDETEKDAILNEGSIYYYSRKECLFRQGDPIKYFYVMCDGAVQEFRQTADGREFTVDIHKAGSIFCKTEMFLEDGLHHANAIAVENVNVMELPIDTFKECFHRYSSLSGYLLFSLSQFALLKQVEAEQHATMTSPQIVACFLRELCATHGLDPRGFTLPYKKSLIASRLGMGLETFSRALAKLKEHGIIVKGTHVSFQDRKAVDGHWCEHDAAEINRHQYRAHVLTE